MVCLQRNSLVVGSVDPAVAASDGERDVSRAEGRLRKVQAADGRTD
ncbi:hypothetical protein [Natrinema hispanicum]|nr:hypothetical protein [Natrinema hispanicum]